MIKRFSIGVAFIALLAMIVAPSMCADSNTKDPEKERVLAFAIQQILAQTHYRPADINDSLSVKAFDLYLKRLDYGKQFMLQSDVDLLTQWRLGLDDQFRMGKYEAFDASVEIFKKRVADIEGFYKELLSKPFDFSKKDSILNDTEKLPYCQDIECLKSRWRESLQYQTLLRYMTYISTNDSLDKTKFHPDLEAKAREKIEEATRKTIDRISKLTRIDHLSRYMNALTAAYDPHTEYMPPLEKENFDIRMTGRLEGIGATLQEDEGAVKVVAIVPGSASWKQKELEAEDIIIKVAQADEDPVDVVGMPLNDVLPMIRGKKGTEVRLTVRKPDGRIKVIPIIRDVVVIEETYAKAAIIENETLNKRFGYIMLPSFYFDYRNDNSPNCADDIEKLLAKMKLFSVDGVILDLRNNGGGSLQEAVKMSGLFFDKGPVVQVQTRGGNKQELRDVDPGISYGGPLVILINQFSASASEIVAAALQDYGRAVVIGSQSSFGKGTVQQIFEIDAALPDPSLEQYKPFGALKSTIQQFYRINGVSTQLLGVESDIVLPDNFMHSKVGAKSLEYSLPGDTITPAVYAGKSPLVSVPELQKKSQQRVQKKEAFRLIEERANNLKARQDDGRISLNWKELLEEQKVLEEESKRIEKAMPELGFLKVMEVLFPTMQVSDAQKAGIDDFKKTLVKDIYIEEAMAVLSDMMKQLSSR